MRALGIDIGSRFIKIAVTEGGRLVSFKKAETSHNPLQRCCELLKDVKAERAMATGYGRHLLEVHAEARTITEIKAFARGARAVFPGAMTIIDIGGQDTKVISLDEAGNVRKFEMNDRCSAGTGKFLEIMARALGYPMEEFGSGPSENGEVKISSMCTVFAESEVVSLISRGVSRQAIAGAIHRAIADRVLGMLKRVQVQGDVVFSGGCAKNRTLREMLERGMEMPLCVAEAPEITGALGAALYAEKEGAEVRFAEGMRCG